MADAAADEFENISLSDGTASDLEEGSGEDEELDPRVKEELEVLNSTSDEINKLELELEQARTKFHSLHGEANARMNLLYKKIGRAVNKARPFYVLQKEAKHEQLEAQRAVVKFQRANSIYRAARETVALAEERLKSVEDGEKREFDSAWQEMMNHATIKFMESEKEKTVSEQEHLKRAAQCAELQSRLKAMEKDMPRSISKARPYFELKDGLELRLQQEKLNVEDLQRALTLAKQQYRSALSQLESISNEMHQRRRLCQNLPPRTPGVGAENNDSADLPSINLDVISETSSIISEDQISTDGLPLGASASDPSLREYFKTGKHPSPSPDRGLPLDGASVSSADGVSETRPATNGQVPSSPKIKQDHRDKHNLSSPTNSPLKSVPAVVNLGDTTGLDATSKKAAPSIFTNPVVGPRIPYVCNGSRAEGVKGNGKSSQSVVVEHTNDEIMLVVDSKSYLPSARMVKSSKKHVTENL